MFKKCTLIVDVAVRKRAEKSPTVLQSPGLQRLLEMPGEMIRLAVQQQHYHAPDWWGENLIGHVSGRLPLLIGQAFRIEVVIAESPWPDHLRCEVSFFQRAERYKYFSFNFYISNSGLVGRGTNCYSSPAITTVW